MRLSVEVEIPGITVDQAKRTVRDIDAQQDEVPIDLDKVKPMDVLELVLNGTWNVDHAVMSQQMEDL